MTLSLPCCKEAQAGHLERERQWGLGSPRCCSHPNWDLNRAMKEAPWTYKPGQPSANVGPSHCLTTGEHLSETCPPVPRAPPELGQRIDCCIKGLHFGGGLLHSRGWLESQVPFVLVAFPTAPNTWLNEDCSFLRPLSTRHFLYANDRVRHYLPPGVRTVRWGVRQVMGQAPGSWSECSSGFCY